MDGLYEEEKLLRFPCEQGMEKEGEKIDVQLS